MNIATKKPYVIYVAEIIYLYISIIKKKYPNIDTKEAINKFIETDEFNKLSSGALHNEWFNDLKKNNYLDQAKRIVKEYTINKHIKNKIKKNNKNQINEKLNDNNNENQDHIKIVN